MEHERNEALWSQLDEVENLDELRLVEYYGLTEAEVESILGTEGTAGSEGGAERLDAILGVAAILELKLAYPNQVGPVLRSRNRFIKEYYPDDAERSLLELLGAEQGIKKVIQAAHRFGDCDPQCRGDYLRNSRRAT